jgi:hypothetical protein
MVAAAFEQLSAARVPYRCAEHLVLAVQRLGHQTGYAVCKVS